MHARQLGRTGLAVSELGLGCGSYWGKAIFSERAAIRIVHEAIERGVTFFDTGPSYSGGNAEPRLGKALKSIAKRHDLTVATKVGTRIDRRGRLVNDFTPTFVRESVEASLRRLNLDSIAILQLHGPAIEDLVPDLIEALEGLRRDGKVRHLGVNSADLPVINYAASMPSFGVAMFDYNIFRPERLPAVKQLAARGMGILAATALGRGRYITKRHGFRPQDLWYAVRARRQRDTNRAAHERLRFLNDGWSEGWTPAQIALAYVLACQDIACAVFGTTRLAHLKENLGASGKVLDVAWRARLDRALDP